MRAVVSAFDDPVVAAVRYLRPYVRRVEGGEPDGKDYDPDELIVIVQDGGGAGEYAYQLSDTRLTFEVRSGDRGLAADTATLVDALIRDWPYRSGGVYYRGALSRPTFSPEADRRIPAYVWTVNLSFRGHSLSV
ncbi:hypothetical protein [Rothia koreensis]|uniref:hypothetical protein n=1 Tax=Rothia koreensis TaxID=592378 RepID=UPI0019817484|nr:hypothetical protein [Rothia koreensis]